MATQLLDPREETLTRCTRHVSSTGAISYTCMSESDPTQEGYYTLRMRPGYKVWSCNCPAGREGRFCKHQMAVQQLEGEFQADAHEKSSVKQSGARAYARPPFSLLKVTGEDTREGATTMVKLNIKKGDVPETDDEVEKALEQMRRQDAAKQARLATAKGKDSGKHARQEQLTARTDEKETVEFVAPGVVVIAPKEAAKPAAEKPVKAPKPRAAKKDLNPKGHVFLTPRLVIEVFNAVDGGMSREQASEKFNISLASVGTVMSPPKWFATRMAEVEPGFEYPTRTPKEKKEQPS